MIRKIIIFLNAPFITGVLLIIVGSMCFGYGTFGFWGDVMARGETAKTMGLFQGFIGLILLFGGVKIGIRKLKQQRGQK